MRRGLWTGLGLVAVLAIVVLPLRDRLPSPSAVGAALREADPRWLAVAAAAEFVSMGMFARQQRRLLTAFGVTLRRRRVLALTYSRSAISISLPAGSAVSAAYAFQQFRAGGADRKAAAAVMVLSGVLSALALAAATANWLGDLVCLIAACPRRRHRPRPARTGDALPRGAARAADPAHAGRHRRHRGQPAHRPGRGGCHGTGRRRGRADLPAAVLLADHPDRPGLLGGAAAGLRCRRPRPARRASRPGTPPAPRRGWRRSRSTARRA